MKLSSTVFLALVASTANAFRDQTQKKADHRRLEEDLVCTLQDEVVRVDGATNATEMELCIEAFPGGWRVAEGLFEITLDKPPFATPENPIKDYGWCIDYDRPIDTGCYHFDVFTAYDKTIHTDAVNYPEYFPNLVWLINNVNVGDIWPKSRTCKGGEVRWRELQGAVWWLIDDNQGQGGWYMRSRVDCISREIAAMAKEMGNDYQIDCMDPNEQIPIVYVSDRDDEFIEHQVIMSETNVHDIAGLCECGVPEEKALNAPPKEETPASSSGDPHFKTWTGEKFDYHGECDLVLVDNPTFGEGKGLRVHIRTTRVKYFSYIEKVAIQIGDDVLEFDNDVDNFLINGEVVGPNLPHVKTMLGDYVVRRDPTAISIRLRDNGSEDRHAGMVAKIDLHTRKNGFPAVILDGGKTDIFKGSMGLLGEWETGKKLARDGQTEMVATVQDATEFALEWQVRDNEPMLFKDARFPQFPTTCTPPMAMPGRLGSSAARAEAEAACAHWESDMDDCIFDVMATRDVLVAEEGHIIHVQ